MALPDDFRSESRKRWGAQAEGWASQQEALRTRTMPVAAWMIDAIDPQPGQSLLELAAGTGDTGLLAAELIAPAGTLISSDFAPEMLQAAQRRAEELGITNVRFKQIDADTSIDLEAGQPRRRALPLGLHADGRPGARAARDAPGAAAGRARRARRVGRRRTRTRGSRCRAARRSPPGSARRPTRTCRARSAGRARA